MDDTESTENTSVATEENEVALEKPKTSGGLASKAKKTSPAPKSAANSSAKKDGPSDKKTETSTVKTEISEEKAETAGNKSSGDEKAPEPKKTSTAPKKKTPAKKTTTSTAKKTTASAPKKPAASVAKKTSETPKSKEVKVTTTTTEKKETAGPKETSEPKEAPAKGGVRRKGPIGGKNRKPAKVHKSEFGMRMCIRCPQPFEPVEADEVVCPKCKGHVATRFSQLFGDEDPYSPQPTLRTNKIARVIIRKNSNQKEEPERDIAEESLAPIDRYDDD